MRNESRGRKERRVKIEVERIMVHTRRAFTIARSSSDTFERVVLTLRERGIVGRGEAAPTSYYEQDAADAAAALERVEIKDPWDIEGVLEENGSLPSAALSALDSALHDLAAKRLAGFPILKIKVGGEEDFQTVRAVAGVSEAILWVDANEAFSPEEAPEVARELAAVDSVRMIEQPVPASAGPEALRA